MIPLSVCIITKNEAAHLEKCLQALQPYPFEIVVVDTGSTDNSKAVAAEYTDKIYDFAWIDDFSAARNFAADHASHDIIFAIDTDEFLTQFNWEEMQSLIKKNPSAIGQIKRFDYFEGGGKTNCQISMLDRIYHKKYYHYEKAIHEVLTPSIQIPHTSYPTSVEMEHAGYLGSAALLQEKAMRNIKLLLREVEQEPEEPYHYFQLAQSYMLIHDEESAFPYFQKAMERHPSPQNDYTHVLVYNYGHMLLEREMIEEAAFLLSYYEYYSNNRNYLCLVGLYWLHQNQPLKALPEFVKALTASECDTTDSSTPSYYIGYIYELFGKKEIARTHYQNCGADFAPAVEALARLDAAQ